MNRLFEFKLQDLIYSQVLQIQGQVLTVDSDDELSTVKT